MSIPKLLTKSDMAARWNVTRQVVNNWSTRHTDFPPEVMRVDNGRLPLYLESDVDKYEKDRNILAF
jgi:hypothetical protein